MNGRRPVKAPFKPGVRDETFANPYQAAALGYLDDVIQPRESRKVLIKALGALLDKEETRPERKHGNIPL